MERRFCNLFFLFCFDKLLFVDRTLYDPSQTIRLFGVLLLPLNDKITCKSYHCVALLSPLHLDQSFPVVLRSINDIPDSKKYISLFFNLLQELKIDEKEKQLLTKLLQNA